jgi:hypothetical protein
MSDEFDTGMYDEDEPTIVEARMPKAPSPPALPFKLERRIDESAWLASLPVEARLTLEMSRHPQGHWPRAPRMRGAVATPIR